MPPGPAPAARRGSSGLRPRAGTEAGLLLRGRVTLPRPALPVLLSPLDPSPKTPTGMRARQGNSGAARVSPRASDHEPTRTSTGERNSQHRHSPARTPPSPAPGDPRAPRSAAAHTERGGTPSPAPPPPRGRPFPRPARCLYLRRE